MANNYSFNQIATILNNIVADAQGRTANISTTPRDTSSFVTMAQTALSIGTDPIMNSITQLINRTVFAYRPYNRKFKTLDVNNIDFGNITRKITPLFSDGAETQPMYNNQPADGSATDMYTIKKPKALETHFIGAEQWEVQAPTVFVDQLKTAFKGPDELSEFMASQVGEVSNEIEQQSEQLARMTVTNFIGAKLVYNSSSSDGTVIKLLSEYNTAAGLDTELTPTTVYQPENFPAFVKWAYARIQQISEQMTERSTLFHKNLSSTITPNGIMRHSPKDYQRLLMYSPFMAQVETMVLSGLYHDNFLSLGNYESVNFWQNINAPMSINVTPSYLDSDGTVKTGSAQAKSSILGILYDRDAMGTNIFNEGAATSPLNAKGKYYNTFYHFAKRYWNDTTENAVVFLME